MDESERESDERFAAQFEAAYAADVTRLYSQIPADIAGAAIQAVISFGCIVLLLNLVRVKLDSYVPIFIGVFSGALRFKRSQAARARANGKLESASDPRLVGVLARLINSRSRSVRRSARIGLRTVLPLVRSRHAHLIDATAMNNLLGLVSKPTGAELTVRVIRSLEHVGNDRAIEPLQRLADAGLWQNDTLLRPADIQAIADAAAASLPYIQQRADLARQCATLLRPSSHSDESLLRPTIGAAAETESQLLRAAHQHEDGCE